MDLSASQTGKCTSGQVGLLLRAEIGRFLVRHQVLRDPGLVTDRPHSLVVIFLQLAADPAEQHPGTSTAALHSHSQSPQARQSVLEASQLSLGTVPDPAIEIRPRAVEVPGSMPAGLRAQQFHCY